MRGLLCFGLEFFVQRNLSASLRGVAQVSAVIERVFALSVLKRVTSESDSRVLSFCKVYRCFEAQSQRRFFKRDEFAAFKGLVHPREIAVICQQRFSR